MSELDSLEHCSLSARVSLAGIQLGEKISLRSERYALSHECYLEERMEISDAAEKLCSSAHSSTEKIDRPTDRPRFSPSLSRSNRSNLDQQLMYESLIRDDEYSKRAAESQAITDGHHWTWRKSHARLACKRILKAAKRILTRKQSNQNQIAPAKVIDVAAICVVKIKKRA